MDADTATAVELASSESYNGAFEAPDMNRMAAWADHLG